MTHKKDELLDETAADTATKMPGLLDREAEQAARTQESMDRGINESMDEAEDKLGPTTPEPKATPTKSE